MDWTSVLEDSGEEDLILPIEIYSTPRLERLVNVLYYLPIDEDDGDGDGDTDDCDNDGVISFDIGDDYKSHRLWRLADDHHEFHYSSKYTLTSLYYLCINYILGVGCLGVPYAFAKAGFILCSIIMILVSIISYITVLWVAEAGSRFEKIYANDNNSCGNNHNQYNDTKVNSSNDKNHNISCTENSEENPLLRYDTTTMTQMKGRNENIKIDVNRYEVIDIILFYLGPYHKILYQLSLMGLMYVGLLAYSQVFCGAIDTMLGNNWNLSGLSQIVFGIIVVPLSCMELDEQVTVQSIMATVRFVAIFTMVVGSIVSLLVDDQNSDGDETERTTNDNIIYDHQYSNHHPPYFAPAVHEDCQMSYTVCWSGFGVAFSTAIFSQLFQHSVPGLIRPLSNQASKVKKIPKVFRASLMTTCSIYIVLGITAASYFGADTKASINLNFAPSNNFLFGFDPNTTSSVTKIVLKFISNIVVIFPALDTLSVFPLISNTLGSNLLAASGGPSFIRWIAKYNVPLFHRMVDNYHLYSQRGQQQEYPELIGSTDVNSPGRTNMRRQQLSVREQKLEVTQDATKLGTIFWRLVASIPPLIASLWSTDLSFSLLLAGVAGLYVAFFAPSLMHLASLKYEKNFTTPYSGWWSYRGWAYPILLFATFSLGIVLLQIYDTLLQN